MGCTDFVFKLTCPSIRPPCAANQIISLSDPRTKAIAHYTTQVTAWQTAGYPALMAFNNFTSHGTQLNGTVIAVTYWNSNQPQPIPLTASTVVDALNDQNGYVQPYAESINYQGGLPNIGSSVFGGVPSQAVAPPLNGYQQSAWPHATMGIGPVTWGSITFTTLAGV